MLRAYAWAVVVATLFLITVGGHVTTKDAGMAVPDWPLSFGELNPPGWMDLEDVRLEHGHRLVGAAIGLLTMGLAAGVWCLHRDRFARWLALWCVVAVIVQGVMGGLRVTLISRELAIVHGVFGQVFLLLLAGVAMRLGFLRGNPDTRRERTRGVSPAAAWLAIGTLSVTLVQLVVAAVMRHYKAGMAIPDFPLAFGQIVPPMETFPIAIHFAHRVLALVIVAMATACAFAGGFRRRWLGAPLFWFNMALTVQIALGAHVVLTGRNPAFATWHVVIGAVTLLLAMALAVRARIALRIAAEASS